MSGPARGRSPLLAAGVTSVTGPARVLQLLPDLAQGGGQQVVLQLVAAVDRDRFVPVVAALAGPDALAEAFAHAGAPPIFVQDGGRGTLRASVRLARLVRGLDVELIHVHSGPDRKVGQLAALIAGVPVVGHLHSPWAHLRPMHAEGAHYPIRLWSRAKAAGRRWIEDRVVRQYIAAGPEVAAFHAGLLKAPIATVSNGVELARFTPATPRLRRQTRAVLGLPVDEQLIVCVGRLARGKGQAELIEALGDVPDARLLLLGDGDQRTVLEELTNQRGLTGRVHFLGNRDDVASVLPAAEVFVLASVSEGLPLSVLEAMATALPIVAYELPGLLPLVTDGVEGRLVPAGDRAALVAAIKELLGDPARRAAMGHAARETVEARFDARAMARGVEDVYENVLCASARRFEGCR